MTGGNATADPAAPCYICDAEPGARCDAAWYLYALQSTRCPIRDGNPDVRGTPAEDKLLRGAVQLARASPVIHAELVADEPAWQRRLDRLFDHD
jgi:hypothetical protein